jgi:hypothetical protein
MHKQLVLTMTPLLAFATSSFAATLEQPGGTFDWNVASNWTPEVVPDNPSTDVQIINNATSANSGLTVNLDSGAYDLASLSATSNSANVNTRVTLTNGTLDFATGATLSFAGNDQSNQELEITGSTTLLFDTLTINSYLIPKAGRQRNNYGRGIRVDVASLSGTQIDIVAGSLELAGSTPGFSTLTLDPSQGNLLLDDTMLTGVDVTLTGSAPTDINKRSGVDDTNLFNSLTINGMAVAPGIYTIDNASTAATLGGGTIDLTDYFNFELIGDGDNVASLQVVPEPASLALLGVGGLLMLPRRRRR